MYRYSVDNAITYSSEDLVLFKESPFASFMERLTLENPSHGIPADIDSSPPVDSVLRQDDIADTLRLEGREVALIDWDSSEQERRADTLAAMRRGVDFVVNGQLALGPLSGSANLLMRTSGFSELGDFLFVPCSTQEKTTLQAAFRLCFLADLLHSLQGQLPPQMLIIRGGSNVVPLQTEDHIFHFRAVKQRFMTAQREFRKHRMPDPAESSHFGRWSDCANELLKQRALAGDDAALPLVLEPEADSLPIAQSAQGGGASPGVTQEVSQPRVNPATTSEASTAPLGFTSDKAQRFNKGIAVSDTLANQARTLSSAMPASSTNTGVRAESAGTMAETTPVKPEPSVELQRSALLTDLEFIGKDRGFGGTAPGGVERRQTTNRAAPDSRLGVEEALQTDVKTHDAGTLLDKKDPNNHSLTTPVAKEPPAFASSEPEPALSDWTDRPADRRAERPAASESLMASDRPQIDSEATAPHPLDSGEFNINHRSIVDRDDAPIPSRVKAAPPPTLGPQRDVSAFAEFEEASDQLLIDTPQPREKREPREPRQGKAQGFNWDEDDALPVRPFSSHLITNRDPED